MNKVQKFLIEALIGAFLLLFFCWLVGYWWNALGGAKFELKSCWDGFTTLAGAGIMAALKYIMDSLVNSEKNKMPYDGGDQK